MGMQLRRVNLTFPPFLPWQEYMLAKECIIKYERDLLRVFGFIVHCDHPHKLLISFLRVLDGDSDLIQTAWNIANDRCVCVVCNHVINCIPFHLLPASHHSVCSAKACCHSAPHHACSLRTTLCVRFRSEVVAAGCIFYAARRLQVRVHLHRSIPLTAWP
jgi:hypothetical protein